jgi:hypothetical protein
MLKPILLGIVMLDILYTLDSMLIKITPINIIVLAILFIAYCYLIISFSKEVNNDGTDKRRIYGIDEKEKTGKGNYRKIKKDRTWQRNVESKRN